MAKAKGEPATLLDRVAAVERRSRRLRRLVVLLTLSTVLALAAAAVAVVALIFVLILGRRLRRMRRALRGRPVDSSRGNAARAPEPETFALEMAGLRE